jgi:hypothetical protein
MDRLLLARTRDLHESRAFHAATASPGDYGTRRKLGRAMLTQDKTAFIEQIQVTPGDKQADKRRHRLATAKVQSLQVTLEVRMAERVVRTTERLFFDELSDRPHLRQQAAKVTERDLEAARASLERKQRKLAKQDARVARLEEEARKRDGSKRASTMFRLHSANHYVGCSERRFLEWSSLQQHEPIWVATERGKRWWWYSDRFWWGDEGFKADDVKALVFELDLEAHQQRDAAERLRTERFGRRPTDPSI